MFLYLEARLLEWLLNDIVAGFRKSFVLVASHRVSKLSKHEVVASYMFAMLVSVMDMVFWAAMVVGWRRETLVV